MIRRITNWCRNCVSGFATFEKANGAVQTESERETPGLHQFAGWSAWNVRILQESGATGMDKYVWEFRYLRSIISLQSLPLLGTMKTGPTMWASDYLTCWASSSAWKMECDSSRLLRVLPISPRVCGFWFWLRGLEWGRQGAAVCWMGEQCPLGISCSGESFVKKVASYCNSKWSGVPSGHVADSGEAIKLPVTGPCQTPPNLSAWSKIHYQKDGPEC